jgi:putative ABC transport system permease protein
MLKNYIVIALRLLRKNKIFSLINILGLSTGVACCILITLYIQDEFNYEKGFSDHDRIFRINTTFVKDGVAENGAYTSPPIAFGLKQALPGIEAATRVMTPPGVEQHIVRYGDKTFFEKRALLVDSTFFDVFPYKMVEGNAKTALQAPASIVISQALRDRIFGPHEALDEILIVNSGQSADTFRVTGVLATPAYPSHVNADLYMSMNSNGWGDWVLAQTTWANNNMVGSYLKLQQPEEYKNLESKFAQQMDMHAGEELKASGRKKILYLQALDDIRLYSNLTRSDSANDTGGGITYVYIIATIGFFILLLACINFMNLTTARSSQRAGEVGIRKSMGAFKAHLIRQFLGESMVMVLLALIVSFILVFLALPVFNSMMQKELAFTPDNLPFILTAALVISLLTGLIAGSYPAFFLSSLKPTQVLKSKSVSGGGSQWLRKSLVVIQFVITITLISSIAIIQQQLGYIQSKTLGFNKDQVIMIPLRTTQASQQYESLKEEFRQVPGVIEISASTSIPSTPLFSDWMVYKQGSTNDQSLRHEVVRVDESYFKTLDIPLLAGRDFIAGQDNLPTDTINPPSIIVNEASLKAFDIPLENAAGNSIFFEPGGERYEFRIIGVVKNFHQFSLHEQIGPMLFLLPGNLARFPYMAVSIKPEQYSKIYENMKSKWDHRINDAPFETIFLNENIKKLYAAEARTSMMLTISTGIALIISCLGLYGLSVYVAERKTKEIGIRKVVGASVESIVGLLSREYIKLIAIAFAISIPLGYYGMEKWLEGFAYRINPGIMVFFISGFSAFFIAWITISVECFRAARKNPVETLRSN